MTGRGRPNRPARYTLVSRPEVTADVLALAGHGPQIVTATAALLGALAHGRVTGKQLRNPEAIPATSGETVPPSGPHAPPSYQGMVWISGWPRPGCSASTSAAERMRLRRGLRCPTPSCRASQPYFTHSVLTHHDVMMRLCLRRVPR